jgi:flagellar biosynthesis protein FlhF
MNEQRYRFVVRSADEAVEILREKFGPNARVVSVRQVEGKGLARFLSAPKLEVTAEVVASAEVTESESAPVPAPESAAPPQAPVSAESPVEHDEIPQPVAVSRLVRLVRSAGISAPVMARLQAHEAWSEIERLPAGRALGRVAALLSAELQKSPRRPLGNRIVFLGGPGAGKTTALCKLLAADIFVRQQSGAVLKLDLDCANPSDGLSVFCDAMGVSCARGVMDLPELDEATRIYVDLPGLSLDDAAQTERLAEELTTVVPTSHVLVVNAAYDGNIIKHLCRAGEAIGCTHLVLTHCDELIHWGKLCDVLLGSGLTPLFLSTGQNVAGDLEENVIPAILARTFPMLGREAAEEAVAQ